MSTDVPTTEGAAGTDEPDSADSELFQLPDGDDLRRLREEAGLSIKETAAAVGASPGTVRSWEDGQDPYIANLRRLLEVLRDPPENIDVGEDDTAEEAKVSPDDLPGLIDAEFLEEHGTTDVKEAIRLAEQNPSETPASEFPRCPACLSRRWWPKGSDNQRTKIDTAYRCGVTGCNSHFDERAPPEAEVDHAIDTVLRLADTDTCSVCGDTAHLFAYDAETSVGGYACWDHVGDLLARGEAE